MLHSSVRSGNWKLFTACGTYLSSDFPFTKIIPNIDEILHQPHESATWVLSCVDSVPISLQALSGNLVYSSPYTSISGDSFLYIYRERENIILYFPDLAVFFISGKYIYCQLLAHGQNSVIEDLILTKVIPCCLTLQAKIVLHASTVEWNGRAIAFMANSGCGKSTLASAFIQIGAQLVSDDHLVLDFNNGTYWAYPSYPQLHYWPDQADYFLGRRIGLDISSQLTEKRRIDVDQCCLGSFSKKAVPIDLVYLPSRITMDDHDIPQLKILSLTPRDALVELVRYSYLARVIYALGLSKQHLELLSSFASQVTVRQLFFPNGYHNLKMVVQAIITDSSNTQRVV